MAELFWVGITGHDGVGKSSLARTLREHLNTAGANAEVFPLAEELRHDLLHLGYETGDVWAKPTPGHMRDLLRAHGFAARQVFGEDHWIEALCGRVEKWSVDATKHFPCECVHVVITDDVRHTNEAKFFVEHGILIALDGPNDPVHTADLPPIIAEVFASKNVAHARLRTEQVVQITQQVWWRELLGALEAFVAERLAAQD